MSDKHVNKRTSLMTNPTITEKQIVSVNERTINNLKTKEVDAITRLFSISSQTTFGIQKNQRKANDLMLVDFDPEDNSRRETEV